MEGSQSSSSSGNVHQTMTIVYGERYMPQSLDSSHSYSESSTSYVTSSCQDSTYSMSVFEELNNLKENELILGYHPLRQTMSTTMGPKMDALHYIQQRKMFSLFNFLMSHLLVNSPEDPLPFLISLVERCLEYRDGQADPPLLFHESHVRSVYIALDPLESGAIDYQQYINGMITLGVSKFDTSPQSMEKWTRVIPKEVFICEANKALLNQIDNLVGKDKSTRRVSKQSVDGWESKKEKMSNAMSKQSTENVESTIENELLETPKHSMGTIEDSFNILSEEGIAAPATPTNTSASSL